MTYPNIIRLNLTLYTASAWWYPQRLCTNKNFFAKFAFQFDECSERDKADGLAFVIQSTRFQVSSLL